MFRSKLTKVVALLVVLVMALGSTVHAATPEYIICLQCETPCYVFEFEDGKIKEALCQVCGNDDPEAFVLPEEAEDLES